MVNSREASERQDIVELWVGWSLEKLELG